MKFIICLTIAFATLFGMKHEVTFYGATKSIRMNDRITNYEANDISKTFEEQLAEVNIDLLEHSVCAVASNLSEFDITAVNRDFYFESIEHAVKLEFPSLTVVVDSSGRTDVYGLYYHRIDMLVINSSVITDSTVDMFILTLLHELTHAAQDQLGTLGQRKTLVAIQEVFADVVSYKVYRENFGQPSVRFSRWLYSVRGLMRQFNPYRVGEYKYIEQVVRHLRNTTLVEYEYLAGGMYVSY